MNDEMYHDPNEHWMHGEDIDPDDAMKSGCFVLTFYSIAFVIVVLICILLSSCTTTKYVTVEKIKHDTTYVSKLQRDSIWLHDSIMVSEKGDTVKIEKWHTKYVSKEVHDTTYISKRDTIPQPYPVVKMVEKPLSKTERGFILLGIVSLMGIVVWMALKLKRFLPLR